MFETNLILIKTRLYHLECRTFKFGYGIDILVFLVTNVNYGFSVTLNTPIATFNQNYTKFLLALAAQVDSSNVNTVTINSIVNGSVIVNGNVSTNVPNSNSAQLSIYLDNMKNLLLASNFIAGMPIAAS